LLIASYNELDFLPQKVANCLELTYELNKLRILFVTDGSNDGSELYLASQNGIDVLHQGKRAGKIMAMNRGMEHVTSEIVIFTDANTLLNKEALQEIVKHFVASENVGCVAGAKRILLSDAETASGAGEGAYWKYESALKKWDSELNTVVGAATDIVLQPLKDIAAAPGKAYDATLVPLQIAVEQGLAPSITAGLKVAQLAPKAIAAVPAVAANVQNKISNASNAALATTKTGAVAASVMKGGSSSSSSVVSDGAVIFTLALLVFGGGFLYLVRSRTNNTTGSSKENDAPPKPGAVRNTSPTS
jgi:hypothetical protein